MAVILGSNYTTSNGNIPISGYSDTGGGVVQTVYNHYLTPTSQTLTVNGNDRVNNAGLGGVSITPKSSSNGILIYARWSGEIDNLWNVLWGLERDGTYLTDPGNTPGSRGIGVLPGGDSYAAAAENNASTPAMVDFWWYDQPGTTSTITYYVTCRSPLAQPLYINRTFTDSNADGYERMSSAMMAWEIAR